jgi:hypothetical protein
MLTLKLRKMIFGVGFWTALFAAIVIFNTIWALTH